MRTRVYDRCYLYESNPNRRSSATKGIHSNSRDANRSAKRRSQCKRATGIADEGNGGKKLEKSINNNWSRSLFPVAEETQTAGGLLFSLLHRVCWLGNRMGDTLKGCAATLDDNARRYQPIFALFTRLSTQPFEHVRNDRFSIMVDHGWLTHGNRGGSASLTNFDTQTRATQYEMKLV